MASSFKSELDMPIWAALYRSGVFCKSTTYNHATELVKQLQKQGDSSACVVTTQAASRFTHKAQVIQPVSDASDIIALGSLMNGNGI